MTQNQTQPNETDTKKQIADNKIKNFYYLSYGIGVIAMILSIISFFAFQYLSFLYLALSALGIYFGYRTKEIMRSNTGYVLSITAAVISLLSIGVFIFLAASGYAF